MRRFPYDSGIGGGGIPFWEFTAPLVLDSGAVGVIFKVPPSTRRRSPTGRPSALGLDIDTTLAAAVRHQCHLHRVGDVAS